MSHSKPPGWAVVVTEGTDPHNVPARILGPFPDRQGAIYAVHTDADELSTRVSGEITADLMLTEACAVKKDRLYVARYFILPLPKAAGLKK